MKSFRMVKEKDVQVGMSASDKVATKIFSVIAAIFFLIVLGAGVFVYLISRAGVSM